MKEYKFVQLNKGIKFSRNNDLAQCEAVLNQYIADGWQLQQIVSPNDLVGALIAIIYKEN